MHVPFSHRDWWLHLASYCLISVCLTGCSRPSGPQRLAISGEVLFGQEPLESGRIRFIPIEETTGPVAVAVVTDGIYVFDRENGPVLGKNRVQIESLPDPGFDLDDEEAYAKAIRARNGRPVLPPELIPPEYNARSNLVATIEMGGETELDFELKKPNGNQRR